jgi:hypothetical protein
MPTLTDSVEIDASAADAWEVLRDVSILPELSPSTVAVEVDGPLVRVGQTFRQTVRLIGRSWTSTWTVTDLEVSRRLGVDGSLVPGVAYRLVEELTPLNPSRCRLRVEARYELPMGALGRLASRVGVERRVASELDGVLQGVAARASSARPASS